MEINLENKDKILALLREGICPICGKQFKMPLVHINHIHGIKKNELKDALMIGRQEGFTTPEIRKKLKESGGSSNNGITAGNFGKRDEVSKEKMSIKKKMYFTNHPEKLQAFMEGSKRILPDARKKALEFTRKRVVRVSESGEIKNYKSMSDAARENNVSVGGLSDCLSGKYRTLGGYFWGTPDNIPVPGKIVNTKSGVKGVSWSESRQKWMAYIRRDGRMVNLGRFASIEEAIKARKEAEERHDNR